MEGRAVKWDRRVRVAGSVIRVSDPFGGSSRFALPVFALLGTFLPIILWGQEASMAIEEEEAITFEQASEWLEADRYEDASHAFGEVLARMVDEGASSSEIAAAAFNQGLSSYLQAESIKSMSPRDALNAAHFSRDSFLQAARERQGFRRAGLRLDAVAGMVEELMALVAEEERREQEQEAEIDSLLERIQELLEAQTELKQEVADADIERRPANRRISGPAANTPQVPANVERRSLEFVTGQEGLGNEGLAIASSMRDMDQRFSLADQAMSDAPAEELDTVMKKPLELMGKALEAQADAADLLKQWQYWPSARSRQQAAIDRLQEIIDLFASSGYSEGEGDWEEEDWEDYSEGEDGEGMSSSMPAQGDFRKDAMMQPLPLPNFSAEEVLMEEMGSQQFREQQRAKANAGKVEKDW